MIYWLSCLFFCLLKLPVFFFPRENIKNISQVFGDYVGKVQAFSLKSISAFFDSMLMSKALLQCNWCVVTTQRF